MAIFICNFFSFLLAQNSPLLSLYLSRSFSSTQHHHLHHSLVLKHHLYFLHHHRLFPSSRGHQPSPFCFFLFFEGSALLHLHLPCQETTPSASPLCCAVLLPLASVLQQVTIFFLSSSREQRSSCSVPARPHCWPLMCAISL